MPGLRFSLIKGDGAIGIFAPNFESTVAANSLVYL